MLLGLAAMFFNLQLFLAPILVRPPRDSRRESPLASTADKLFAYRLYSDGCRGILRTGGLSILTQDLQLRLPFNRYI